MRRTCRVSAAAADSRQLLPAKRRRPPAAGRGIEVPERWSRRPDRGRGSRLLRACRVSIRCRSCARSGPTCRPGKTGAGRQYADPAAGQEPVPDTGKIVAAQDQRSLHGDDARGAFQQAGHYYRLRQRSFPAAAKSHRRFTASNAPAACCSDAASTRLEAQQLALLVGMVKGPSRYNPMSAPETALLKRRNLVLRKSCTSRANRSGAIAAGAGETTRRHVAACRV